MSKELDITFLETLTPNIEENERNKNYLNALDWAIKQEDVQNIAVSGSYGSGKSSVLKTFSNTLSDDEVLEISVATFNTYQDDDISSYTDYKEGNLQNDGEDKDQTVEKSSSIEEIVEQHILQQIFYRVPVDKVPNSRFKRISIQKKQFEISDFIHLLLGGLFIFIFFQSESVGFMKEQFKAATAIPYGLLLVIFIVIGLIGYIAFIITNTVSKINGYGFTKFGIGNASLELNPKDENSMINKNLDEIIYFFSVTNYNIVIFEDLDRFESLEIFERLRELNGLLNKNQDINRKIVFIYAIRDDIFSINDTLDEAQNRTKFFDFIIPIVKIANSSNAKEIIRNKLNKENNFAIAESLINGVSFFINDMRLIKNICNEFVILYNTLNSNMVDNTKLFAMTVYKNIYPKDFNDLLNNNGDLFQISEKKKQLFEQLVENLNNEKEEINQKINASKDLLVSNYKELHFLLRNIHNQDSFNYVQLKKTYSLLNVENFKEFMDDLIISYEENPNEIIKVNTKQSGGTNYKIKDYIEHFGTPNLIKKYKLVRYKHANHIEMFKKRLEEITQEINIIKSYSLNKLYKKYKIEVTEFLKIEDKPLLNYLTFNGYIAEDYHNYITYFYEGSLSNNDNVFLGMIISGDKSDFAYKLDNVKEVICNFPLEYLSTESVYNTAIINEVYINSNFDNEKYHLNLSVIKEFILNNFELTIKFFNEVNFFRTSSYNGDSIIKSFFIQIKDKNRDLESTWATIFDLNSYLNEYSSYILEVFNDEELIIINFDNSYSQYISNNSRYYLTNNHFLRGKSFLKKMAAINVEFEDLSVVNSKEVLNSILEYGIYKISFNNLNVLLEEINYTSLLKLDEKHRNKLENNILYVINIFLELEIYKDDEESFIKLLNHPYINEKHLMSLISIWDGEITLISEVNNTNLYKVLFNEGKYKFNINNIEIFYLNKIGLKPLIGTILTGNSLELITNELEEIGFSNDFYRKFSMEVLTLEILDSELRKLSVLIKPLESISVKNINENTLRFYIENQLVVYNQEFYQSLKSESIDEEILLLYLYVCVQNNGLSLDEVFKLTEKTIELFKKLLNGTDIQLEIKQELILNYIEYMDMDIHDEDTEESINNLVQIIFNSEGKEYNLLASILESDTLADTQKTKIIKVITKNISSIHPELVELIADVIDKIGVNTLEEQDIEKLLYSTVDERAIALLLYQMLKSFEFDDSKYLSLVERLNSPHNQLSLSRTRNKKLKDIPENIRLLEFLLENKYITNIDATKTDSEIEFNVADIRGRIISK